MKNPSLKILLVIWLSILSVSCSQKEKSDNSNDLHSNPPNIVYILADDMGYQDWGSYGQETIKTPVLDQLAAEGMRFTDHYAGAPVCAPSRSVLMTGLHPGHTPIRGNDRDMEIGVAALPRETPTIAEVLKQNTDYTTALCGRWHLGGEKSQQQPSMRGFDYTFGKLSGFVKGENSFFVKNMFDEMGQHLPEAEYKNIGEPVYENGAYYHLTEEELQEPYLYISDMITDKAIDFMRDNQEKPFFLYMAYSLAHTPLVVPPGKMEEYGYAEQDWPEAEKVYATMVTYFDELTGRLIDELKALGLAENTLVIITSDNGPHGEGGHDPDFFNSNGPLRGMKRDLYEGGLRMPMIAWWPGKVAAGAVSDHPSAFWDVMATVNDVAGIDPPDNTDGISFLPVLTGAQQDQHEYMYWEFNEIIGPEGIVPDYKQALRKDQWKLIRYLEKDQLELYNLQEDIGESNNVVSQHPDVTEMLLHLMDQAHQPSARFPIYPQELQAK